MACGKAAHEIAEILWISEATVRHHQTRAAVKMRLSRPLMVLVAYIAHLGHGHDRPGASGPAHPRED